MMIIPRLLAVFMLFAACGRCTPGYYSVLCWVVCPVSIVSAISAFRGDHKWLAWFFVIVGILYNPVFPIHPRRAEYWDPIDFIVAMVFMFTVLGPSLMRGSEGPNGCAAGIGCVAFLMLAALMVAVMIHTNNFGEGWGR